MSTRATTQAAAADTFNADRETALQLALDIAALLESYYEGERIDWSHAGTMGHIKGRLAEAFDTLLGDETPECAICGVDIPASLAQALTPSGQPAHVGCARAALAEAKAPGSWNER